MNFLAHAYLSFNHPPALAGNIFSDFVKGKKKFDFPEDIQAGIALHRAIDEFTDTHAATRSAKIVFRSHYGLYSGAFMDIVYDHFLANDNLQFTDSSLYRFSLEAYDTLERFTPHFPKAFSQVFPYMKQQNWLYNYRNREGIARSFAGLTHRAAYISGSETAFRLFEEHYDTLKAHYEAFFPEVKMFAYATFQKNFRH